ncbi:MAG: hypothetical protein WC314_25915 [Vulcanimicrobiota bacterium]
MNATLTTPTRNFNIGRPIAKAVGLDKKDLQVSSEQDVLETGYRSEKPLMKMTHPKASGTAYKSSDSKVKLLGRMALETAGGVAASLGGLVLGGTLGLFAASVAPVLGVAGGAIAGAAILALGAASKGGSIKGCLGLTVLGGALAATGSPLAGLAVVVGTAGLAFQGLYAGAAIAKDLLKPEETLERYRELSHSLPQGSWV